MAMVMVMMGSWREIGAEKKKVEGERLLVAMTLVPDAASKGAGIHVLFLFFFLICLISLNFSFFVVFFIWFYLIYCLIYEWMIHWMGFGSVLGWECCCLSSSQRVWQWCSQLVAPVWGLWFRIFFLFFIFLIKWTKLRKIQLWFRFVFECFFIFEKFLLLINFKLWELRSCSKCYYMWIFCFGWKWKILKVDGLK